MTTKPVRYVKFMGTRVDNVTYQYVRETIKNNINKKGYICLTCVESVITAAKHDSLRKAINKSLLSLPDGMPLVWYGKLASCRTLERISGSDLLYKLLTEETNYRHYLLGGTQYTIDTIILKSRKKNPSIKIAGYSPPFKEFDETDNEDMFRRINSYDPDIIWVCFGGKKQEPWMFNNIHRLRRGIMIGVGSAFRAYTGELKEPPTLFKKLGLQWAFRTIHMLTNYPLKTIVDRQLLIFPVFLYNFFPELLRTRSKLRNSRLS